MFSGTIQRRSCLTTCHNSSLPPTFLLPLRARFATIAVTTDPDPPESSYRSSPLPSPKRLPASNITSQSSLSASPVKTLDSRSEATSISSLLPLLISQPPHYIIAHLHSRPYLLTSGDTVRLPFHMPSAPPGTILRLTRASAIGSRDYTFRGQPWVDEKHFVCRARVIGVEGEPMRVEKKTKRRQRKVMTIKSKMRFTVLRCFEVKVLDGENSEEQEEVEGV